MTLRLDKIEDMEPRMASLVQTLDQRLGKCAEIAAFGGGAVRADLRVNAPWNSITKLSVLL